MFVEESWLHFVSWRVKKKHIQGLKLLNLSFGFKTVFSSIEEGYLKIHDFLVFDVSKYMLSLVPTLKLFNISS